VHITNTSNTVIFLIAFSSWTYKIKKFLFQDNFFLHLVCGENFGLNPSFITLYNSLCLSELHLSNEGIRIPIHVLSDSVKENGYELTSITILTLRYKILRVGTGHPSLSHLYFSRLEETWKEPWRGNFFRDEVL
jgi:hypothetical protein